MRHLVLGLLVGGAIGLLFGALLTYGITRGRRPRSLATPRRSSLYRRRRIVVLCGLLIAGIGTWLALRNTVFEDVDTHGASIAHITINSRAVGEELDTAIVVPPQTPALRARRSLLIFLHGRSGDDNSYLDAEPLFAALKRLGKRAPFVVFPNGGDHSYWHAREDGNWDRYVMHEVIPEVAETLNANPHRVAIGGISMGGFGALDLVLHHPGRFCAVGGHSPALWTTAGETAPGAFDDAADFARNDVIAAARAGTPSYSSLPIWLDAGNSDPFRPGDQAFEGALRQTGSSLSSHTWPGGHDRSYWDKHWLAYLRFYSRALAQCR